MTELTPGLEKKLAEKVYSFGDVFRSELVKTEPLFAGYRREMDTLVRLASEIARGERVEHVLLFGLPGLGKSTIPMRLQWELKTRKKIDFTLVVFKCNQVAKEKGTPEGIEDALYDMQNILRPSSRVLLVLDEFDSIAHTRELAKLDSPHLDLFQKIMYLVGRNFGIQKNLMILFVTNYPNLIEHNITARVNSSLYLPPIDDEGAIQIISTYLPQAKELFALLRAHPVISSANFTTVGLVESCQREQDRSKANPHEPFDLEGTANRLLAHAGGLITGEHRKNYEEDNKGFIAQSRALLKEYSDTN